MCLNTSYFFIFLLTNNNTNLTVNKQSTQQVKCIMYVISATTLRSYGSRALKLHHVFSSSQMFLCDCVICAEAILILNIVFSSVLDHVCRQLAVASKFSAPCGFRGCKNGPAPFPGRMSYKATKPGLVFVVYLSMFLLC